MPTREPRRSRILERAAYARTPNNFLVNDPDGFPSDYPPAMWWMGYDSGGGAYPIGPNGPWSSGQAAAVPTVTRATSLIVGPLTVAPYRVLDSVTGQPPPSGVPRWLTDPMLARPTFMPEAAGDFAAVLTRVRSGFWADWIRSAIWYGLGAFVWKAQADNGQPQAGTMHLIQPRVLGTVRREDQRPLASGEPPLCWALNPYDMDPVLFDRDGTAGPWHITVLRNPLSPVDAEGMSKGVFDMHPTVFGLAGTIDNYQAGQFRSGVPNGYLKTEVPGMTQPEADKLKGKWLTAHGGDRRSIAVLNSTTSFVPINLSPVDAALAEVKRLNVADCAFAFGLDPMTLGAGLNNSATYTNLRDAWENHRDFGLGPWIAGAQDTLTALLPGTQSVTVNLDGFANPAASERFAAYTVALNAGILTLDEVRALEGLPPLPPTTDTQGVPA
jgi:hypothetical protein